ncbi:MAG: purine-nucleoside phosphorylase [Gemmatimonadales bacterium]
MTQAVSLQAQIDDAVEHIREHTVLRPEVAIVLGTGLGALATQIREPVTVPYDGIPGFVRPTVESHAGRLILGTLAGRPVAALAGRFHRYEGYDLARVTFPIRVLRALGAGVLVLSGACGGMHPLWEPGDLVLLADHINLMGDNPLLGPNDDRLGPRFPDMTEAWDGELRALARQVAAEQGVTLREGVYAAVTGPNLETRAEYRMLRTMGADVVGMSTVPEAIAGVHAGFRVLGVSIITDQCLPDALKPADIHEIIATAARAEPALARLVAGVVERLA